MNRLTSLAAPFVVVVLASACGGAPPMPPMRETQRVAIAGQQADTIGETIEGPIEGHMLVRTNDGREVWVREASLSQPQLAVDAWVLVAHAGGIVPAQVVRALDDYIEVRVGTVVGIAPMHTIFAILHSAPTVPVTDAFSTAAPTDPSTAATATH
jgi:hypothetical protein